MNECGASEIYIAYGIGLGIMATLDYPGDARCVDKG